MKCEFCGMELYGDFDVCPSCGFRLDYTRKQPGAENMPTFVLKDYPPMEVKPTDPGSEYTIDSLTPIEDPGKEGPDQIPHDKSSTPQEKLELDETDGRETSAD